MANLFDKISDSLKYTGFGLVGSVVSTIAAGAIKGQLAVQEKLGHFDFKAVDYSEMTNFVVQYGPKIIVYATATGLIVDGIRAVYRKVKE